MNDPTTGVTAAATRANLDVTLSFGPDGSHILTHSKPMPAYIAAHTLAILGATNTVVTGIIDGVTVRIPIEGRK